MDVLLMLLFLVGGFVLLVKGADFFVDGACDLSAKLRIPAYVVGLTVVAFGTSLPEAAVSITASMQGSNEIAIGNIIGSNTFNTLVVLGASVLFSPVLVKKNILKRDFPFNLLITVALLLLIITPLSNKAQLTRFDGIALLVLFVAFMTSSVVAGKKADADSDEAGNPDGPMWKCLIYIILGLAGVIAGGQLTVTGATDLARMVGLSETVIGLTVVAIGTSLPELVTSVVAARKNQNDIAVGNVIGSNIFNILFILGASSALGGITPEENPFIDICILFAVSLVTYLFALKFKKINKGTGIVMILMYVAYTAYLLIR